ncbi:MAG: glutamine synthetase [Flavobacteriales bacterium]|nr:glutamine synthetase [Flavobacteriales bacterium]|tara:strand:+ start:5971 stop:6975 length:1005 start_codon:yes stop_codon:yes gene_type:complete
MTAFKFEYIWLDGYQPEANLRSKTKVIKFDQFDEDLSVLPDWSFDGSSTQQADGSFSDCVLRPVKIYKDPARLDGYLVLCEVMNADGAPHESNTRSQIKQGFDDFWFGFEQEYTLMDGTRPLGFPEQGFPNPQGMYYCSVGNKNVAGREIVEAHLDLCLEAGLNITGINAEVLLGQWEFQVLGQDPYSAGDDLWVARYLLHRVTEEYGVGLEFHPKPVQGDWNGSGMHCNFSNKKMRDVGGKNYIESICDALGAAHTAHIAVYGSSNEQRLTGLHETQSIEKFSYGVSDRGASIRIPISLPANDWKGYLEDRRPASNADPYKIVAIMIDTVSTV